MLELAYDDLFSRLFKFIRLSGASSNGDSVVVALKLVEEQLVDQSTGAIDRVMTEVQSHLNVAEINLPLVCPKVNRGSIGYRDE